MASVGDWEELISLIVQSRNDIPKLFANMNFSSLIDFYYKNDAFVSSLLLMIFFTLWCYFASEITGNCSQVDRLWSLIPPVYATHFLLVHFLKTNNWDVRLTLMFALNLTWGLRLTYNFARKGGYKLFVFSGDEDYRWPVLRSNMPWIAFKIFNIVFIATYQNILIWLFSLPTYIALKTSGTPLNSLDYFAAALFLFSLIGETTADQQMWNFQNEKHRLIKEKKALTGDYKLGFLTHGMFRYSRHPNFLFEQLIWYCFVYIIEVIERWSYYTFSIAATGKWINWSVLGAFLLTLLFQGSTWFTELISTRKYPKFKEYQKTTSALMFWFPGDESWKK